MRRRGAGVLLGVALVVLAVGGGVGPAGADRALDDALFELQLIPLEGRTPPPFALERLADGARVTLAEQRGRPVLLYFWASW